MYKDSLEPSLVLGRLLPPPAEPYPERCSRLQAPTAVLDLSYRCFSDTVLFAGASQQGEDAPSGVSRRA
jgi:hypothetical protein